MKSLLKLSLTAFCLLLSIRVLVAQEPGTSAGGGSPVPGIIGVLIALLLIVATWKVFTKAGQPGWASIIPIYNLYIWCKIVGRPWWWILLMLIPLVNFIVAIILCIDLAKSFGKGAGFGIGIALLGVIFLPILGFGSAQYEGPVAGQGAAVDCRRAPRAFAAHRSCILHDSPLGGVLAGWQSADRVAPLGASCL